VAWRVAWPTTGMAAGYSSREGTSKTRKMPGLGRRRDGQCCLLYVDALPKQTVVIVFNA
jgi:hypothetical protein